MTTTVTENLSTEDARATALADDVDCGGRGDRSSGLASVDRGGADPINPFISYQLTDKIVMSNRLVMLPLTRTRAEVDGTPTELMAEHYRQRAGSGLIVTEATAISVTGRPFLNSPGIYTTEHAWAWRAVTSAVHNAGGKIFLQINHAGRVNNLQHLARPVPPVAPSAIPISRSFRNITINIPRVTPYAVPRALPAEEVGLVVSEFRRATELAAWAGFDGVEIHADSGYLIHQFLSTNVNQRGDRYGASSEGRCRFLLEVLDAVVDVAGSDFVAVKLTPGLALQDIAEDDLDEKYPYLISELNRRRGLAFLHLHFAAFDKDPLFGPLVGAFAGPVLVEGSRTFDEYCQHLADGRLDLIGFGRRFIANPDLVDRLSRGRALSDVDPESVYTPGPVGYTDYPAWDESDPAGSVIRLEDTLAFRGEA